MNSKLIIKNDILYFTPYFIDKIKYGVKWELKLIDIKYIAIRTTTLTLGEEQSFVYFVGQNCKVFSFNVDYLDNESYPPHSFRFVSYNYSKN